MHVPTVLLGYTDFYQDRISCQLSSKSLVSVVCVSCKQIERTRDIVLD